MKRRSHRMVLRVERMEPRELLSGLLPALNTEVHSHHALVRPQGDSHTNAVAGRSQFGTPTAKPTSVAGWDPFAPNTFFGVRFFEGGTYRVRLDYAKNVPIGDTWWKVSLAITDGPPSIGGSKILDISFQNKEGHLDFGNKLQVWPVGGDNFPILFKKDTPVVFRQVYLYFSGADGQPVKPKTGNTFNSFSNLIAAKDPTGKFQVFNQSNNPYINKTGTQFSFLGFFLDDFNGVLLKMNVQPKDVKEIHFAVWITPGK